MWSITPLFDQQAMLRGFEALVTAGTDAVICTHVSNVFGYILPIRAIARICRDRGVPLIVDASQSAGSIPIHMGELGADFIAMPGHKGLYGPQGTGVLLCGREGKPLLFGGTGSNSKEQSIRISSRTAWRPAPTICRAMPTSEGGPFCPPRRRGGHRPAQPAAEGAAAPGTCR